MNVNYIGTILKTTSIKLLGFYNDVEYIFLVQAGNVSVNNDTIEIYDYVEDQWFSLSDDSFKIQTIYTHKRVLPSYPEFENYEDYISTYQDLIEQNNDIYLVEFQAKKDNLKYIDTQRVNLNILKNGLPIGDIFLMKQFNITDLSAFQRRTDEVIEHMRCVCMEKLQETGDIAISNLLIEKEKFVLENDIDSIEEVDIIIDMIKEAIDNTSVETFQTIKDIYTLWPPILLPVPFQQYL